MVRFLVLHNLRVSDHDLPDVILRVAPSLAYAVYIAGDIIEVTEVESGALQVFFSEYFERIKPEPEPEPEP